MLNVEISFLCFFRLLGVVYRAIDSHFRHNPCMNIFRFWIHRHLFIHILIFFLMINWVLEFSSRRIGSKYLFFPRRKCISKILFSRDRKGAPKIHRVDLEYIICTTSSQSPLHKEVRDLKWVFGILKPPIRAMKNNCHNTQCVIHWPTKHSARSSLIWGDFYTFAWEYSLHCYLFAWF